MGLLLFSWIDPVIFIAFSNSEIPDCLMECVIMG